MVMKKIFTVILTLITILLPFSILASAETPVELSIKDETVYAGDEFTLNVFISDNSRVSGAVIDLNYDNSMLEFISAKEGAILDSGANRAIRNFDGDDSKVRFTYMSPSTSITSAGIIFSVTFKALDSANGDTDVSISIPNAADFVTADLEKISYEVQNSTVTVLGYDIEPTEDESEIEDITDDLTTEPITENIEIIEDNEDAQPQNKICTVIFIAVGIILVVVVIVIIKRRGKKVEKI